MGFITLIVVCILLIISYEDFTKRLIHWYYFPVVAMLLLIQLFQRGQYFESMTNIGLNILIVLFMLLMTTVIYSLRRGKLVFILDKAIGTADLLVFGLLCISLSPINLVLFMLVSFLAAALYQIITLPFFKNAKYIPLAGIVSILLSMVLVLQHGFEVIDLTNDFQTLGIIGGYYLYR